MGESMEWMKIHETLIQKGVVIPAPQSVVFDDIDPNNILPGTILYPGTTICGRSTFVGRNCKIGLGGGAYIENTQIGNQCVLMQGSYRDATLLDGVAIRNGAELRDNCLLEEGVELGHTVGLKQTILFPYVVLGSLINFCDAIMCGGKSRKQHSEIGSCMALYNFTPQGDKFASLFGDVASGVFLNRSPIFIGGQTQIISPVHVGFGAVIAAGSKLSHDVDDDFLVSKDGVDMEVPFDASMLYSPDRKVKTTILFIKNLHLLHQWYGKVRLCLRNDAMHARLYCAAQGRIEAALAERQKRFDAFCEKIPASMQAHVRNKNDRQVADHQRAIERANAFAKSNVVENIDFSDLCAYLRENELDGIPYLEMIRAISSERVRLFVEKMHGWVGES